MQILHIMPPDGHFDRENQPQITGGSHKAERSAGKRDMRFAHADMQNFIFQRERHMLFLHYRGAALPKRN